MCKCSELVINIYIYIYIYIYICMLGKYLFLICDYPYAPCRITLRNFDVTGN
jgi:hypothetical protein